MADAIHLRQIDESNIGDHPRLTADDNCLYLYEYTSGGTYATSATNDLISNLKKKPSEKLTKGGYQYKAWAIDQCSQGLRAALNPEWLEVATLVPVPGSKTADDPDYDDRMVQVCRGIAQGLDVRSLVYQSESTVRAHEVAPGWRPSVEDLLRVYRIDESVSEPPPRQIGVFDDVLTAGTHFRAMTIVLGQRFPGTRVTGIFVARRIFPDPKSLFF